MQINPNSVKTESTPLTSPSDKSSAVTATPLLALVLALAITAVFTANAFAVPADQHLTWQLPFGNVTFDGYAHARKGLKCIDCHDKIFNMHFGDAKMTMKAINDGKFCGVCHNNKSTFSPWDGKSCSRCHGKSSYN